MTSGPWTKLITIKKRKKKKECIILIGYCLKCLCTEETSL